MVRPTALQALAAVCSSEERSFRANLHCVLRRTTGLLAALQEELTLYDSRRHSLCEWKRHLEGLRYLSASAMGIFPGREAVCEESQRRSLSAKHNDLRQVIERVRKRTRAISTVG